MVCISSFLPLCQLILYCLVDLLLVDACDHFDVPACSFSRSLFIFVNKENLSGERYVVTKEPPKNIYIVFS